MPPSARVARSWSDGRDESSPNRQPMIAESEARRRILEAVSPSKGVERVSLEQSLDRCLASDVVAGVDLPGFDNSSMDGYAVRADEAMAGATLTVVGEQPAGGDRRLELSAPGTAIRIFTGAPLPGGADAVIMQEDTRTIDGGVRIEIREGVERGENIRPLGADVCVGQRLLAAGRRLGPADIGLLASQGLAEVAVRPRPQVGIVTTGDELLEVGAVPVDGLGPGMIYNSNGPMLASLVRRLGGEPCRWHAPDNRAALREILKSALETSDFLLIAGGVSVGVHDHVKAVLADLEVTAGFWRVRIKPGKPFLFGQSAGEAPVLVFGLPGNPVSAFVTYHLFAAPALRRWQGDRPEDVDSLGLTPLRGQVMTELRNPGDRPHYLRISLDGATGGFKPAGLQQSHALCGLSRADALLRLEPGETVSPGQMITAWQL